MANRLTINMTETKEHRLLKEIGMAFLYNQNCFLVATEVHINRGSQERLGKLDKHWIIDVCGVGEKYIPLEGRLKLERDVNGDTTSRHYQEHYKYNVVRGIEVKVSRADFEKGFVCSGCNYNYLLTPEGLIWSSQVPKEVGIIKVSPSDFKAKFIPEPTRRFEFEGLRILRNPTFKKLEQHQIDNAISSIAKRSTRELINRVAEHLSIHNLVQP